MFEVLTVVLFRPRSNRRAQTSSHNPLNHRIHLLATYLEANTNAMSSLIKSLILALIAIVILLSSPSRASNAIRGGGGKMMAPLRLFDSPAAAVAAGHRVGPSSGCGDCSFAGRGYQYTESGLACFYCYGPDVP